jgi:hypothetical protein
VTRRARPREEGAGNIRPTSPPPGFLASHFIAVIRFADAVITGPLLIRQPVERRGSVYGLGYKGKFRGDTKNPIILYLTSAAVVFNMPCKRVQYTAAF